MVKTSGIKKLTPEIVRLLIDKVIASEKVKTAGSYKITVTICLTHIGEIELPSKDKETGASYSPAPVFPKRNTLYEGFFVIFAAFFP